MGAKARVRTQYKQLQLGALLVNVEEDDVINLFNFYDSIQNLVKKEYVTGKNCHRGYLNMYEMN